MLKIDRYMSGHILTYSHFTYMVHIKAFFVAATDSFQFILHHTESLKVMPCFKTTESQSVDSFQPVDMLGTRGDLSSGGREGIIL